MTSRSVVSPTVLISNAGIDMGTTVMFNITTPPIAGTEGASKKYVDDTFGAVTGVGIGSGVNIFAQRSSNVLQFKTIKGDVDADVGRDNTHVVFSRELFFNPFQTSSMFVTGSTLNGTNKWRGGILAPNGNTYSCPVDQTTVVIFNPSNNVFDTTTITGLSGTNKWVGEVLAPNFKIYAVPDSHSSVLIVNTATNVADTTTLTGLLSLANKWNGAVLYTNGNIYGVPRNHTRVLIINSNNNTLDTTTLSTSLTAADKWIGGALAPNGRIYCAPYNNSGVLIINPIAATVNSSTIVGGNGPNAWGGTSKWYGAVLAQNGRVYMIPHNESRILIVNPNNEAAPDTTTMVVYSGSAKWRGGILAPDGKIYCAPDTTTNILIINPETNVADTTTLAGFAAGASKWIFSLILNGKICGIPDNNTNILLVPTGIPTQQPEFYFSSFNNKL